jgi:hypothetical protein
MLKLTAPVLLALFLLVGTALGQSLPANTIAVFNTSGAVQTNRPVSVARPFRRGEIRNFAQASINGTSLLTQTDVKNRWPDGSLKFAIVSFVIPNLPISGSVTVSFSDQSTGNNTGFLTQSQMLDAAYDFEGTITMAGASTQTASARQMLTNGAFRYWLQGPVVTAVIIEDRTPARAYDKDFGDGSKALHPIFEAWFYPASSKADVGYTVENTWTSSTALKGMRDLTYSVTLRSGLAAPATVYSQASFNHIGRSRWHKRFWIGADPPGVRIDYNLTYLVTTKAIPSYDTGVKVADALVQSWASSWQSANKSFTGSGTGLGLYSKDMNGSGENPWIGLMNTWDTIYLYTMDDRMREMSLGNADLAGRIPMHYREADSLAGTGDFFDVSGSGVVDTFGRTVSVNARKTATLRDLTVTCGGAFAADEIHTGSITTDGWGEITRDHMPDVAYVPYLMTGRYYYLEELQYWGSYVLGNRTGCYDATWMRQGEAGYLNDSQIRGDAWGFRTLSYAAFLSPDNSPEKAYYEDKLLNNIAKWEGAHDVTLSTPAKAVHWTWGNVNAKDSHGISPLGSWSARDAQFVQGPLKTDGSLSAASSPWEENFLLSVFGMSKQLGYPTHRLLTYMARQPFNILLNPNLQGNRMLIETYRYPTIVASTNNWVQSWASFKTFYVSLPTSWSLGASVDHGYGYIAMAAISFLFDQGVDGFTGQQAWNFMKANKPEQDRFATVSPKWAIVPAPASDGVAPAAPCCLTVR